MARAEQLLRAGDLDGQAVAVAGYYDEVSLPCAPPRAYVGPLEGWCHGVGFTDTRDSAQVCRGIDSNSVTCSSPPPPNLAPFSMSETSGDPRSFLGGTEPVALVLIGHAGDARQWLCTAATRDQCASAFVVDRVAWAEGHAVPPPSDQTSGTIAPRMKLAQVAAAIGLGDELLTGAAFSAGEIATVDPRWTLAGDTVVWLVRSLEQAGNSASGTRPEVVWLVDDATGKVMDSHPLKLNTDYRPARLWPTATVHGLDCCSGGTVASFRVNSGDGTTVYDGPVSGGTSGGQDSTTFGGAYASPLVLPGGTYSITVWLSTDPGSACSTQVTLSPLGDLAFNADFPPNQACTFQPASPPSPGP